MSCGHRVRHWFSVYGAVGLRSPKCRRCGAPNPRPLTEQEMRDYEAHMEYLRDLRGQR